MVYLVFAVIALLANIILIVGLCLPFKQPAAGIAGIVLTMGMAVDANVLVFERIREELRRPFCCSGCRLWTTISAIIDRI